MAHRILRVAAIGIMLICALGSCLAQDEPAKRRSPFEIDLLAMNGSSTNLTANGEGVVALRSTLLFQRGATRVNSVDPAFKLNLPPGYSLFSSLSYLINSEAIVSGPNLITLNLPSASNKEVFDKLRILHAERNDAEPDKPLWSDASLLADYYPVVERQLTKAEFEK